MASPHPLLNPVKVAMPTESEIGKNIRRLRRARRLTLEQLARRCGFTKGYLSKVENSESSPPVSTLLNISEGLGVSISEIFGESSEATSISLVKKDERQIMARNGTMFGYSYETLAHKYPHKHMEPYLLTSPAHAEFYPLFQHRGEEMLFVLKGTMIFLHGDREYVVEEGDCIYFDAGIPHHGRPAGDEDAECLMVIYTPPGEA
jgi:transcriptional regulator with XRE-family HTH domain